jgi:hypothetical protein
VNDHHQPGTCFLSVTVRFARPGVVPNPAALVAGAVQALIADSRKAGAVPDAAISISVGAGRVVVELFDRVAQGHPLSPATTGAFDQVSATLKAEPDRFAAVAFAHVVLDGPA